jgi:hypothetical protein
MRHQSKDLLKNGAQVAIGASETNTPITGVFSVSAEDSKYMLIYLTASSTTVTNAITAKLQTSYDGGSNFIDVGSAAQVSITGDGDFEITHMFEESNDRLLWPLARVVITSGVSDAVDVDAVYVTRR